MTGGAASHKIISRNDSINGVSGKIIASETCMLSRSSVVSSPYNLSNGENNIDRRNGNSNGENNQ